MNDTIEKQCLVCNENFKTKSGRSKFCSEACKQRNKRDKTEVDHTKVELEPLQEQCPSPHKIDREYFDYRAKKGLITELMEEDMVKNCMSCKKEFTTRLRLMRWCSFNCHEQF